MPSRWDWLPWELQLSIIQLVLRRGPLCIRPKASPLDAHVCVRNFDALPIHTFALHVGPYGFSL